MGAYYGYNSLLNDKAILMGLWIFFREGEEEGDDDKPF